MVLICYFEDNERNLWYMCKYKHKFGYIMNHEILETINNGTIYNQ